MGTLEDAISPDPAAIAGEIDRRIWALPDQSTEPVRAAGGTGDSERTLAVCALLGADHDNTIVKALSWALRALAI